MKRLGTIIAAAALVALGAASQAQAGLIPYPTVPNNGYFLFPP